MSFRVKQRQFTSILRQQRSNVKIVKHGSLALAKFPEFHQTSRKKDFEWFVETLKIFHCRGNCVPDRLVPLPLTRVARQTHE